MNENHLQSEVSWSSDSSVTLGDRDNALRLKITELRKKKGYTQKELAQLLDISPSELCKIEGGERQVISKTTLAKLSAYLGVSMDYLMMLSVSQSFVEEERFYDFSGQQLNMFEIAKKLYLTDNELLFLLCEDNILSEKEDRELLKNYLKLVKLSRTMGKTSGYQLFTKLLSDFRSYCSNFFRTLLHFQTL